MVKSLKILIFSFLVGGTLAACFFFSIKETPKALEKNVVYAYQVGVYSSLENAQKGVNFYPTAKIFKDNDFYRILIGVTLDNEEILTNYFSNYEVYKKPLVVDKNVYDEIKKYDELLKNSSSDNYNVILNKMLGILPNDFQN